MFGEKASIIGTGKFETSGPLVIANIQTLIKHIPKVSSMFGNVIIDECHHVPATTFRNILDRMRSRYKIGLSGTLGRKDQKHILLTDYFSKNIYKPEKENVIDPTIVVYPSNFKIPGNFMEPWATRVNKLAYNKKYQEEIINVAHAQAERGHKVLVLSDRIEFLECCDSLSMDSVCITSKTKDQASKELSIKNGENSILYGSISIYKEGISINELSCVILASPINNIYLLEQIVGRIMRKSIGKMKPEVIDILLKGDTGRKQYQTRHSFYAAEGFKIVKL